MAVLLTCVKISARLKWFVAGELFLEVAGYAMQKSAASSGSAVEYREFAEQCIEIAEFAQPGVRQRLLKMAEIWLKLSSLAPSTDIAPAEQKTLSSKSVQ